MKIIQTINRKSKKNRKRVFIVREHNFFKVKTANVKE